MRLCLDQAQFVDRTSVTSVARNAAHSFTLLVAGASVAANATATIAATAASVACVQFVHTHLPVQPTRRDGAIRAAVQEACIEQVGDVTAIKARSQMAARSAAEVSTTTCTRILVMARATRAGGQMIPDADVRVVASADQQRTISGPRSCIDAPRVSAELCYH